MMSVEGSADEKGKLLLEMKIPGKQIHHPTYDLQVDKVADVGRGRDLAFVDPTVPVLRVLDLQHPVLRVRLVDRLEALISRVGVPAHRQQVDVSVSDPRDLQQHLRGGEERMGIKTSIIIY